MADIINKNARNDNKESSQPKVKEEVKEVLVKTMKDTSTKPTKPEERAKIESEVEMIKIGRDFEGRWLFARSDRITEKQKKQRQKYMQDLQNETRN